MSSTNKTPILELSQFEDSDKPSWRGDYNRDMQSIEGSVKGVKDDLTMVQGNLNGFRDTMYTKDQVDSAIVEEALRAEGTYVKPAALAPYALAADVAARAHTHPVADLSDFTTKTDARIDAKISAMPNPTSVRSGLYADRPAAAGTPANAIYVCTDIPEQYILTGGAWVPYGSAGNTIGRADITARFESPGGPGEFVDIPGLSLTIKAGERPLVVQFDGDVGTTTSKHPVIVRITIDGAGVARCSTFAAWGQAENATYHVNLTKEVAAFAGGSQHVVRAQIAVANTPGSTTGKGRVDADADVRATLRVVTA